MRDADTPEPRRYPVLCTEQLAMVIAMTLVRMVQMPGNEIVRMVAVRHRFMATVVTMLVDRLMGATSMVGRAGVGIQCRYRHGMIVNVALVFVVQMAIVQVVGVAIVYHGRVATVRPVPMTMVAVDMMMDVSHLLSPCLVK